MIRSRLTEIKCICSSDKTIDVQDESICIMTCAALLAAAALSFHATSEIFFKISLQFQLKEDFTDISRNFMVKEALRIT